MSGEGFAFARWVNLKILAGHWMSFGHGWRCCICRRDWEDPRRERQ